MRLLENEEIVRIALARYRIVNFGPIPIDIEIVPDDASLHKMREVRVRIEDKAAAGQVLDVGFERRGANKPAIFQLLLKRFRALCPRLNLLNAERVRMSGKRGFEN